ncbi:acyl-CoA thioesterase [Brevibacterium daeguense]|nr:thioesterase family protein [Brevibacterium daeguense]
MSETIDDFPIRTYDKLRYSDTDKQGHVNNAVYSTFFESGRVEFIDQAHQAAGHRDSEFVIAQLTIKFLQETHWPGMVEVGSRVQRVGNSSLVVEQALFNDERLCATAESVIVQINTQTRRPQPFDEDMRQYFSGLQPQKPSDVL